jgi:PBSX family phage terminase large subunit
MSPNFSLSSISFELQRMLVKTFDLEITKDNAKDRVLELANGSTVRVGSISTVDSCVGRSYTLILFDEAALGKDAEEAFNVSLRPTLDRPDSKCIFISTPRGKNNFFSRFYQRGFSDEFPQWASITATYHENPRMSEVDVEEARRSMSKALFEQEYLSSFSTFEGQIYQGYLPEYTKEFEHKEGMEYIGGVDVGFRDPTAFVVISYDNNSGIFHVLEDYVQAGVTTSVHAKVFQDAIDKYGIESIFIDSAAAQTAADLSFTYNIGTIKAKKSILDGIAYVQALIEHGKLNVSPNCLDTLAMLDQYKWKTDAVSGVEKPDHDKYSHAADALRYALYSFTTGY